MTDELKTSGIIKSGDAAQYAAEPHSQYMGPDLGVMPSVRVLMMNPDPLGSIAALNAMYEGRVVRDLRSLTTADRVRALDDVQKTHLKAPLEAVKVHFLVEGVDRAFTHQQVRQRTAVFAQESLRFAVPGKLSEATSLPPSLMSRMVGEHGEPYYTEEQKQWRDIWFNAINTIDAAYHYLVETGMPSEEARGLLPHATATRDHWVTDLRNLSDHAGNRLCTQAQFHWRLVFAGVLKAMREYGRGPDVPTENAWQFEAIASSGLFRPVCYQIGHCPFKATFDRACSIRDRVDAFAAEGTPSTEWDSGTETVARIETREWLADPGAARS